MVQLSQAENLQQAPTRRTQPAPVSWNVEGLSPSLSKQLAAIKAHTDRDEYARALEAIPAHSSDQELVNCRAVCLMRLRNFEKAIGLLRGVVLNKSTVRLRPEIADHIKINFAIALFYGGEPAGAMEALSEIRLESDPGVKLLRAEEKSWTAQMNLFRRLDWYLNRIAPKLQPQPPVESVGRFIWDVAPVYS